MLILRSSSQFTFADRVDYFTKLIMQSNLFCFENKGIYHLRRKIKKLTSTIALTYRHCQSIGMTGEAKPSEGKATETDIFVSVICVDESKKKEKTLALLDKLVLIVKGINKFQVMVKGLNRKRWKKKMSIKAQFLLMIQKRSDR